MKTVNVTITINIEDLSKLADIEKKLNDALKDYPDKSVNYHVMDSALVGFPPTRRLS
jgi:hypothetical protein